MEQEHDDVMYGLIARVTSLADCVAPAAPVVFPGVGILNSDLWTVFLIEAPSLHSMHVRTNVVKL